MLITLPYTSLGAEMSNGYNEHSRITAFREGFFALGTLAAIVLPALLQNGGAHSGAGLKAIAVFLLVGLPIAAVLLLWRVREPSHTRRQRAVSRPPYSPVARNSSRRAFL